MDEQADRVRRDTAAEVLRRIDGATVASLHSCAEAPARIEERMRALDREWDVERLLQVKAPVIVLLSLALAGTVKRKFLLLPAAVFGFFAQHALQGWCPSNPRLGVRTQREIERERHALKALRSDVDKAPRARGPGRRGQAGEPAMTRPLIRGPALLAFATCLLAPLAPAQGQKPPGDDKTAKTRVLEAGAKVMQRNSPLGPMDVYLVGFHPMKDRPEHQMEAHHFCHQVNQDFAQCTLFDGNGRSANLTGIEYIISEKLFETLPAEERRFWHPHNAEILSGQLVAPGIPAVAEKALMKDKMNSYGKTWHVWNTGAMGQAGDRLPLGPPMLAWSFNRDGEARPGLVEQRDRKMGIDSAEKRRQRAELQPLARPQSGVDDLKAAFPQAKPIPGVVDRKSAATPEAAASR